MRRTLSQQSHFPASVFGEPVSFAAYGSDLSGGSGMLNFGSAAPGLKYFRMMLRDN
jgi:hypothetical protein